MPEGWMKNKTKTELLEETRNLKKKNTSLLNKLNKLNYAKSKNTHTILGEIFQNAGIGIAIVDINGIQLEVNTFFAKMLGYSRSYLQKKHFKIFTHPEDVEIDLKLFKQLVSGEKKSYQYIKRYIQKNGRIIWGKLTVTTIKEKTNKSK